MQQYILNFKKYSHLLFNLISKDFKLKYRRSMLGVLWSILNPVLMMIVITAVFMNLFKFNVENFPIYYLTGSIIFNFFTDATSAAMSSVTQSGQIIKKVYIPKYIFPLEKCLFAFVNLFFSLIAVLVIIVILKFNITATILLIPIPILYILVFSIGVGLMLSSINVFFRDIEHLYGVIITIWMYLTPIIYPLDILSPTMIKAVQYNPFLHYVNYFRDLVMYNRIPNIKENLICVAFSLGSFLIGFFIFKKLQDKFILHI